MSTNRIDDIRERAAEESERAATMERIADALERLVIAADSIATALAIASLKQIVPRGACANCQGYQDGTDAKCSYCGRAIKVFTSDRRPTDG